MFYVSFHFILCILHFIVFCDCYFTGFYKINSDVHSSCMSINDDATQKIPYVSNNKKLFTSLASELRRKHNHDELLRKKSYLGFRIDPLYCKVPRFYGPRLLNKTVAETTTVPKMQNRYFR